MLLRAVPLGSPGSALPAGVPTAGEAERARAFGDPARGHRFLSGRLALRALVAEAADADPGLVRPAYLCPDCGVGEHGAPGFVLGHDGGVLRPLPVAASMSRAGGWALLSAEMGVLTAEMGVLTAEVGVLTAEVGVRVGVDLVAVADLRRAIPDEALSAAERRRAHTAADPAEEAARLWARKEALAKALGTGLRDDPAELETLDDGRVADLDTAALGLPPGFAAALARVPGCGRCAPATPGA
ncbi:4'-phosphopantetheinyl transferase family protein [Sinomonas halotolerans]|uniref:4'-phosphopantetheinyl transferase superfamily protein n=1 Tax=Sinomonas halotolerans TaxID=1644133 RepID=A0ABU9X778_9MICC